MGDLGQASPGGFGVSSRRESGTGGVSTWGCRFASGGLCCFLVACEFDLLLLLPFAANNGMCNAKLGMMYARGLSVAIDFKQAEVYYNAAIEAGCALGYVGLADIKLFGCVGAPLSLSH